MVYYNKDILSKKSERKGKASMGKRIGVFTSGGDLSRPECGDAGGLKRQKSTGSASQQEALPDFIFKKRRRRQTMLRQAIYGQWLPPSAFGGLPLWDSVCRRNGWGDAVSSITGQATGTPRRYFFFGLFCITCKYKKSRCVFNLFCFPLRNIKSVSFPFRCGHRNSKSDR